MSVTFTILSVLVLIASILMTLIVLLQNSKGGGLASNFAVGNQAFGVRQTTDILEKITWGLAAFIFLFSVICTFTLNTDKKVEDIVISTGTEEIVEEPITTPAPAELKISTEETAETPATPEK